MKRGRMEAPPDGFKRKGNACVDCKARDLWSVWMRRPAANVTWNEAQI